MGRIQRLRTLFYTKQLSMRDYYTALLARIQSAPGNAFISFFDDEVATAIDYLSQQDPNRFTGFGIPLGIKDNMCLANQPVTCASKLLAGYRSPYTATAVQYMIDQGFVPVGRLNMDEFAMGSANEYSVYGPVDNPWNPDAVSGGSSGGSAAAVAAGLVPAALGSDTGGSIRQPAAFCGVVGLKPTYGRVSRYGLVAFASSLDQIGPFAQYVDDVAIMLDTLCGFDPQDATSVKRPDECFSDGFEWASLHGIRVGVPNELMTSGQADVNAAIRRTLSQMESHGAIIDYVDFKYFDEALATYYIIAPAEASSNLSRFDGVRYGYRDTSATTLKDMMAATRSTGFGDEVKRRIILGTYVLSSGYYDAFYGKAQRVRGIVTKRYADLFKQYDIICSPTAPTTAFKKGEHTNDPLAMYLSDIATIPVNLAGLPAISLPCGRDSAGMPVGMQLVAPWFQEKLLLNTAYCVEQLVGFTPLVSDDVVLGQ
jgi:aspartyl-tRNA(Asn)/glutamyl-tRNA(Gln) amidotransferase subunit A